MPRNKKLSYKLFKIISLVMISIFIMTYLINNYLADQYLLYKSNSNLNNAYEEINELNFEQLTQNSESIKLKYNVSIVWFEFHHNEEAFNDMLRIKLNKEKITLNRIWLVSDGIEQIHEGKKIKRLYDQGKLEASFLVNFFKKDNMVIVIGQAVPHSGAIVQVFNEINLIMWITTLLILLLFVWWYMKKITKPIERLKEKSEEIASLNFSEIEIMTDDELGDLAKSINIMSQKLSDSLDELDRKNTNLKTLISDISHELKTPLSLINIYAHGIEDGLDDGTYVKGIKKETKTLTNLIDDLLNLSKLEEEKFKYSNFDLYQLIFSIVDEYRVITREKKVQIDIKNNLKSSVWADRNKMEIALKNIIYNAIKYTNDFKVDILLMESKGRITVQIINGLEACVDREKLRDIFNPFYVLDESRNKDISGTGLGLSIVKSIFDKHNIHYDVKSENNKFIFIINILSQRL